jgi:hypothetical protein
MESDDQFQTQQNETTVYIARFQRRTWIISSDGILFHDISCPTWRPDLTKSYSSLLGYFKSNVYIMIIRDSNRKTGMKVDYHCKLQEVVLNLFDG